MPLKLTIALLTLAFASLQPGGNVLYDGALGSRPDQQGWLYLPDPQRGNRAVQSVAGGVTILDTMAATTDKAGYFASFQEAPLTFRHSKLPPVLDRQAGYSIRVDVRILDEVHRFDRAGFGVIALSQDLKGVELEFWQRSGCRPTTRCSPTQKA